MSGWLCVAAAALLAGTEPSAPAATPGPPVPSHAPLVAADFARLPGVETPIISPNGKLVAGRFAASGKQYLGIATLATGEVRTTPVENVDLNWWRWVNDDWLVIGVGDSVPVEADSWYIRRAAAVSADVKTVRWIGKNDTLGENADGLIWAATDGSARVLIAAQHSIYLNDDGFWPSVSEVDLATGRERKVVAPREGVSGWYADNAGVVRAGILATQNGRRQSYLYRDSADQPFRTVSRADTRRHEQLLIPELFLAKPGAAIAEADDDAGLGTLSEVDLATGAIGRKVAASPGFDVGGVILDAAGTRVDGVVLDEDAPSVRWLDPEMASLQAQLDKAVAPRRAEIVSRSREGGRMIVRVGGADQPGSYYVWEPRDGTLHRFMPANEAIQRPLNPVRTIRYKARDGLEIAAVLTLPARREAKRLPLIVMPHGGPFARDDESWDWWAQFLATRGYAVIQPNYRGSSGYGTPFTRKGEGQWGLAMQDDLNDALAFLASEGLADPKRVCMVGASYGGYAALRAAERDGRLYRCAVSYAGVSDMAAMLRYDSDFLDSGASTDWLRTQAPDLRAVSPLNDAAGFSIPVLVMHGKLDKRVPVQQSRSMVSRLKAAGKPVTYIEQPLADHFFRREADRRQFLEELDKFLQTNNPPD